MAVRSRGPAAMALAAQLSDRLKAALAALLLVPFLAAQFFAPGTMPTAGPDGLEIVICTGAGVETLVLGPDGSPAEPGHDAGQGDVCSWATAGHTFIPLGQPAAGGPVLRLVTVAPVLATPAVRPALPTALPPARAPPGIA